MDEQNIIENLKAICRCQAIQRKVVLKHIDAGARTLAAVQHATGAGSGSCNGKQCSPRIEALLKTIPAE